MSEEARRELIELVVETEEAIARLYEAYANSQPEHEEFWFGLVMQESEHANLMHNLLKEISEGAVGFIPDLHLTRKIAELREFLEEERERSKLLSFTEALEIAIKIELSEAKEDFYAFFKEPSGEVSRVLRHLQQSDHDHARFLEKELEKYGAVDS
ncbi:MAG: hypothetical protein JW712_10985 [Dehalococcoidales bacterium]|nr:hypothetical protein [Dehalococcoidales bacterium]